MVGQLVEVHLHSGKRFLGRVLERDREGMTVRCIPLDALDTLPQGSAVREQLVSMQSVLFFPYVNIEYVDIGGEPLGFDHLFTGWFGDEPVASFFRGADETE